MDIVFTALATVLKIYMCMQFHICDSCLYNKYTQIRDDLGENLNLSHLLASICKNNMPFCIVIEVAATKPAATKQHFLGIYIIKPFNILNVMLYMFL